MHLTPKEIDKLMLLSLGAIAARRKEKRVEAELSGSCSLHQFGSFGRSSRRKNPGTGDDRFHKSIDQK